MNFGTKFRINSKISSSKTLKIFKHNVNKFIKKQSYEFSMPLGAFFEWRSQHLGHFSNFLKDYLNSVKYENQIFNDEDVEFIKNVHNSFFIFPVDQAANNYTIICRKFYIGKIEGELGNTNFFARVNIDKNPVFFKKFAFKKKVKNMFYYNFEVSNHNCLPFIFLAPKFHKNPIKFRGQSISSGPENHLYVA